MKMIEQDVKNLNFVVADVYRDSYARLGDLVPVYGF